MNHIKLIIYGIILGLTVIACGSKSSNAEVSPDDSYGNGFFAPEFDWVLDFYEYHF